MIFPVNGFTVDYDGPTRNFYAWHFYAPDGKTRLEFGDYEQSIKKGDQGRLSCVYDKGKLIEGLMKDAMKNNINMFFKTSFLKNSCSNNSFKSFPPISKSRIFTIHKYRVSK